MYALTLLVGIQMTTSLPICASEDGLSCAGGYCFGSNFQCHRPTPVPTTSITIDISDSTITYTADTSIWFYVSLILACGIIYLLWEIFTFVKCVLMICRSAEMTNAELRDLFVLKKFTGPLPLERRLRNQMHQAVRATTSSPRPAKRGKFSHLVREMDRRAAANYLEEIGVILSAEEA